MSLLPNRQRKSRNRKDRQHQATDQSKSAGKSKRRPPETTSDDDRALAEITSGIGSGRRLNARIEEKFGIPLCFLTEKQWEQVREVSDLPIYARFEINIALRRYWEKRLEKAIDKEKIKPRIRDAIEKVEELISGLSSIASDEDFTKGSIVYFDKSPMEQREILESTCQSLVESYHVLSAAEERLSKPGGISYGPLYELIHELDYVLYQHKGVWIENSKKPMPWSGHSPRDYIWTVLKWANLDVTENTGQTILKQYVRDRGAHAAARSE